MRKKIKFINTVFLTVLIMLGCRGVVSYADTSVEQLIIINSQKNTLNFYENGVLVREFRCATGAVGTQTPQGKTKVANKIKNRPYFKYGIPGGSPNNPLGTRWIGLFSGEVYAVHGTNVDSSIGTNASHGCIRMHNKDVEWLFDRIEIGATAIIKNTSNSDKWVGKQYGVLVGYKWFESGGDKYFSDGDDYAKGWNTINGKKYYFDKDGKMMTGLQVIDGKTYYFGKDGVRKTGWQTVDGSKYYFRTKGDKKGQALKGKTKLGGKYYYMDQDYKMVTNEKVKIEDNYYYFGKDGVMVSDKKIKIDEDDYYFGEDGAMVTDKEVKIGGYSYYFESNGVMAKSKMIKVGNKHYYYKKSGAKLENGVLKVSSAVVALAVLGKFVFHI